MLWAAQSPSVKLTVSEGSELLTMRVLQMAGARELPAECLLHTFWQNAVQFLW